MTVRAVATWDDIPSLVGREFESSWFTVDDDRLRLFDRATYVDENAVALTGAEYPDGLIEGFHLLALLDHLTNEVLQVDDPRWGGWNYGLDRVRFVSPVTTKDRIRVVGSVLEVTPRGDAQLVLIDCAIEVEGRDKPGMTARWRVLWTLDEASV
jgi:acyl dehydratase